MPGLEFQGPFLRTARPTLVVFVQGEAAFVTRMLADAMDANSILERLFEDQLAGRNFPEAEAIIWKTDISDRSDDGSSATLTVYSSIHWLDAMEDIDEFESRAYPDGADDDDPPS